MFLICFSLTNVSSLENVKSKWVPEVRHHCAEVPIVLVGTKLDIREDPELMKKLQVEPVTREMGEQMKNDIGAFAYVECSARTQKGLKEVFNAAIEATRQPKPDNDGKKKKCTIL